jgi:hypothetical protein
MANVSLSPFLGRLTYRRQVMLIKRLANQREQTCPKAKDRNSSVAQGEEATCAGLGLAVADRKRARIKVNLYPSEQAKL